MTSFRSNLNSVTSTHDGLIAIQSRLTTCFTNFRRNFIKLEQQTHQETHHKEFLTDFNIYQHQEKPHVKWYQQNYKDSRLLQKANENLQSFTLKIKDIFLGKFRFPKPNHCERSNCKEGEIVAKLLSSTLIAAQTAVPFDCSENATTIATATRTTVVGVESKMTIVEDSFVVIREEFPELDREIRSILIARAQTGATIGEIKEDYRKNTGIRFPVYEHITDFLLCIPGVMAYCNERGTRIFTVKPNEKNKHIHDLVTQQKAPSESNGFNGYSNNRSNYRRDSGFNSHLSVPAWRTGTFYRQKEQSFHLTGSMMSNSFQNTQQQQQLSQPLHSVDDNNSQIESDGFIEDRGGYYRDNCQYLYNRIYNYENNKENVNENSNSNYNNLNINENQHLIIPCNSDVQNQVEANRSDQNDKDVHLFKRPIGRAVRKSVIRASSPSGSRSSQRSVSDSIYSSDMDYEAHLLDFPLLGDDFFLYLARMELRCKFKKNQPVLQSGLCISGQTIKAAVKRFRNLPYNSYGNRRVIVNIGSVDIMHGKQLVQIEHDFRTLINIINKRGYQPILTTLAPLANYAHDTSVKMKVERFNEFIKREGQFLLVIDIWPLFMTERKQLLFDCYQNEPRRVTGAKESYVFWNKIGRQRVLQLIESNLEY